MKVEDKWQIIFRKKVVSWQYRAVSDFFFFLRVRRVKKIDIKSDQQPRIPGWPRGGPTPPIRVSPSPPSRDVGAQMVFVPTPALPHGPPLQAMASPDSAQTLCWNICLFASHFCWEIRSQTINLFFSFYPKPVPPPVFPSQHTDPDLLVAAVRFLGAICDSARPLTGVSCPRPHRAAASH